MGNKKTRSIFRWQSIFFLILLVILTGYYVYQKSHSVRIPEHVLLEDFQRPLDRELLDQLRTFDETALSKFLDANVLKPLVDDVGTVRLTVDAVEITPIQFSNRNDLNVIISDCSRILQIPTPRVFVKSGPCAYTANMTDPVIVLDSSLFRKNLSDKDFRFIIGHEMGHIACKHVKWMALSRCIMSTLPGPLEEVALLPLLKWSREAEMSADNAGLLCCQDIKSAERTLVRLLLDFEEDQDLQINVNAFLEQRTKSDFSAYSELLLLWSEIKNNEHPFIPDRIRQLREYSKTRQYMHLWED